MKVLPLPQVSPPLPPLCGKPSSKILLLETETGLQEPSRRPHTTDAIPCDLLARGWAKVGESAGGSLWVHSSNMQHGLRYHRHHMHAPAQELLARSGGMNSTAVHELQSALRHTTYDGIEADACV